MTPKEKAVELITNLDGSKYFANYCVNEIIVTICDCYPTKGKQMSFVEYWEEVKKEIEKSQA